jgi:hypothetical protein
MLPPSKIRPTVGQNLAKLPSLCGCRVKVLDLGGQAKMRPLWDRYYHEVDAVVFVADGRTAGRDRRSRGRRRGRGMADAPADDRGSEAASALGRVREEARERGIPLLVFVNKIDRGKGGRVATTADGDEVLEGEGPEGRRRGRRRRFRPDRFDGGALEEALLGGGAPLPPDDPLVAFAAGSARTGEGVRAAFEWAVLAARDAQRERRRSGAGA